MGSEPRGPFWGLMAFAGAWTEVTKDLNKMRDPWDFNGPAPTGADRAISSLDIAALFMTAAHRAVEKKAKGIFDQTGFTPVWVDGELEPHGKTMADLTPEARQAARRRVNRHMRDQMDVLVEFKLFRKDAPGRYGLTDLGRSTYDRLNGEPLAMAAE